MAQGLNRVTLIGNLGEDPEVRFSASGDAIATMTIAVTEKKKVGDEWKEYTEWVRLVLFGKRAEATTKFLSKGSSIYVEGRLSQRKWTDKEGVEKYTTEVVLSDIKLLSKSQKDGPREAPAQRAAPAKSPPAYKDEPLDMDDDIPFLFNTSSVSTARMCAPSTALERAKYGKQGLHEMRRIKAEL